MDDSEAEVRVRESRTLSVLLVRAAARVRQDFAEAASAFDVTPPMARVLMLIDEPTPMRRIADELLCDASYVTGVADQLERAGLAVRSSGADRRVTLLGATESGLELRRRMRAAVADGSVVLRALEPAQREQLRELVERLVESV